MARGKIDAVDIQVGQRIKLQRNALGMSQSRLGEKLGVSFQQIQKYEKGRSRVGAGRLNQIADSLGVPVNHFFEGAGRLPLNGVPAPSDPIALLDQQHVVRMVQSYARIKNAGMRRLILSLVERIATEEHALNPADR